MKYQFYNFLIVSCLATGIARSDLVTITRNCTDGTKEITQQLANQSPSILCGIGMVVFGGLGWYAQQNYITPTFTKIREKIWGPNIFDFNDRNTKQFGITTSRKTIHQSLQGVNTTATTNTQEEKQFIYNENLIKDELEKLWISPQTKNIIANTLGAAAGVGAFLWLKRHPF